MNSQPITTSSPKDRWITFGAATFAAWGYAAAATIANAMLPQIQGGLSASLDQVSWVITASIVASAIGIPPTPWLTARFGARRILLIALVVFTIASTMIALSSSLGEVVYWRIIQALFGAPIMVISQTITVQSFEGRQRGIAMSIWSIALTTGWVFGPAMGAYLAEWQSWRFAFFMVTPISVLSVFVCWHYLHQSNDNKKMTFDWLGFMLLSTFLITLQIVVNRGQRQDWFESPEIQILTLISVVTAGAYLIHTVSSKRQFIRWSIFRDRNFAIGLVITSIFGFVSLAPLVLVPPMLEQVKGLDVVTIGLVVTPRGITQIIVMLALGPYVSRLDPRMLMALGFISYAIGGWMMLNYNQDIGLWDILIPSIFHGLTSALVWLPLFHVLYSTLEPEYHNDASMINGLLYNLIASAGVAYLIVILGRSIQINTQELGSFIDPASEILRFPEYGHYDFTDTIDAAAIHSEIIQQSVMIGYVNIYWLLTWIAIAAIPLLILIPSQRANQNLIAKRKIEAN